MKFSNGALCCYAVGEQFVPRTPDQLQAMAATHGVPSEVCPAYPGDRAMVGRAIGKQTDKAKAAGWLVQPLTTSKSEVVYTIAKMDKDIERERTDYTHADTVKWSSGRPDQIEGTHEVARAIDAQYQSMRGLVFGGDWTATLIAYITGPCQGQSINNGGTYWVPPASADRLATLRAMLDEVGIALFIAPIEPENVGHVQHIAARGLREQLGELAAEVAGFDGTQPKSVYTNRLEALRTLRAKAIAYHDAVGVNLQQIQQVLGAIDQQVREHLLVRTQTVVKKDGTKVPRDGTARVPEQIAHLQALVAQGEAALARAVHDGTLNVDVDAYTLQSVGLTETLDPEEDTEASDELPTTW